MEGQIFVHLFTMNYFFLKSAEVKDTPEIKETLLTLAFCPDQI